MKDFTAWVKKQLVAVRAENANMPAEFWHTRRAKQLDHWESQLATTLHMITEFEATTYAVKPVERKS